MLGRSNEDFMPSTRQPSSWGRDSVASRVSSRSWKRFNTSSLWLASRVRLFNRCRNWRLMKARSVGEGLVGVFGMLITVDHPGLGVSFSMYIIPGAAVCASNGM